MSDNIRQPKQKRSIENKALLLDAAKKLFTEKGYFSTSSNEIVKEAGISIGTFYAYFKDKKAIFMEILEEYSKEYKYKLEEALNSIQKHDDKNHIKAIILSTMDMSKTYYGFEDELMAMRYTDKDIKLYSEKKHNYVISKIKEMLLRINVKNQNLDITAFLFFCLVDDFSYKIVHQDTLDLDVAVEQCVDMIYCYSIYEG